MDGTEWKTSSGDDASSASTSGGVLNLKPKRRSLVERELETSLTTKVTLPNGEGNGEGSLNTSRYGRSRRAKTDNDFCDTDNALAKLMNSQIDTPSKTIHNINILNSTPSQDAEAKPNSATKLENHENKQEKSLSNINIETTLTPDKIYVQKDLIQGKDEPQIRNMFSPNKNKTNSHINNILERSSDKYNLDLAVEKSSQKLKTEIQSYEKSSKATNGVIDTSSVVKTLDFDTGKKKKPEEQKALSKSELFEIESKCEYQVGDLAWARVGTYPFWPCIVTREPYSEFFVKRKLFGRTERDVIHVTFFADNGRRGWVVQHMLRPYCGRQEFEDTREQFTLEDKKKDPRLYAAFFISDKKKDIWNLSVEEAESFLREPKRLRIDMLIEMLSNNKNVKVVKKPKSNKVSRTDSDVSLSESLFDTLFSEDDAKTEDTDTRRSRNKSLDVSEVVTACLDNMVAKTGIPIIQKQSHMDRWLQKAKSKTPEKPPSITPVKRQSLSLKKKQTPGKEKSRKNKESHNNLKAHQEEHDYTKFDIENENPVSNSKSTVSSDNQGYREHVNGVRLDYDVTNKAVTSDYNIETSIVDEVMDGEENEIEVKKSLEEKLLVESMDVDEDTDKKSDDLKANEPLDSVSKDVSKQNNMIDVLVENFASENTKGEETSKSDPEKNCSTMKDIKNNSDDLSQAYSPDVSFEESKKTEKDGIHPETNSSTITCDIDLTSSDLEDTCKVSIPSDKSADKTKKNTKKAKSNQKNKKTRNLRRSESEVNIEPSTSGSHKQSVLGAISIKTPESLNKSISTSQEVSETNKSLGSSFSKSSNTQTKSQDRFSRRTVPMRDNRPKRKCANLGYTIGGTDDPEFLLYLETHQDSIIDENPDLNLEDVVNYLHKTWTYERDIKSDLLKDDDEDIETVEVNIAEERKKDKAVESVPSNNTKDNLPKDLQLVISFEDDQEEVTQSEKIKDSEAETHIETIKPTKTSQKQENNVEDENKESDMEPSNVEINENATVTKEKLESVEREPHMVKIDKLDKTKYDNVKVALKRENLEDKLKTSTKETKTTIQDDVANLMVIQEQKEDIRIVLQREDLEEKLKTTTNKNRDSIEKKYKCKPGNSGTKTKSTKETRVSFNEPKVNKNESILPNKVQDVTTNPVVMQQSKEVDILLHKSKSDALIIGSFVEDPKSTTVAKTLPNETKKPALNNIGENRILTLENDMNSTDEIQIKKANGNDQVDSPVDRIENKVDKQKSESSAEKHEINNDLIQENKQDENVSIAIPRTPKTKALAKSPEKEIMNKIPDSTPVSFKILEASASNNIKSPKLDSKSPTVKNRRSINPSQTEIKKDNVQASPVVKPKEPPTPVLIPKKIVSKTNETIINRPNGPVTLFKKVPTNKTIESAEPTANLVSNQNSNKIPINEKDIPVPKKILVRSASKSTQKEPVVSEGFVDLTEEDDESDDDIPSPEFEVHTVDSKEKEFIDELRKSVLPELMKDIDFKIKKEVCEPEDQTTEKTVESKTDKPKKGGSKPSKDGNSVKNIKNDDDISLDGLTEDALLQSDEEADEVLNSSRLESFENVAKGRTNDLDISHSEDTANGDNVENMEVDEAISPKVNRISLKNKSLSLKKENGKVMNPNHIDNIEDKELVLPVKIPEKVIEKPMVNGYVDKLTIKNISSQPFVVHHVATEKDMSPKMNGCLNSSHKPNDKGALTNGLDIGHKDEDVITQARPKRKLRSKSDSNKKAYNAFDDPEFMVYVESRQDAVMDENPDLSEEDVVKYLHKTWMYEQENKSDRQRDDDIEQSNLVKGLVTETAKPKKVRRKTSAKSGTSSKNELVVRIERMDFTEKRTRRRKIIPNGISEDESIDSDCEIVPNSNVLDTISIFSGPDSTSDYVPSDDDTETSSLDYNDEISLATIKAVIRKDIRLEDDKVDPTHELLTRKGEPMINNHLGVHEEVHLSPDHIKHEDLITPEDLNIVEKKPRTSDQMLSPISSPIKSDMSDESKSKRKQRVKVERNPNFPSAREVNSALDDPDFLKYLELRQDALLDENPHVSQDDLVKYLYKTWVYEQNLKTETEINDEIENANLVKGLNDQPPPQTKKIKKKVKEIQVEKEFKLEKDTEVTPKDKPRRKAAKQYYHEDDTDIEDELEVFEIFKMKKPKTEPSSKTDEKTDKDKTETAVKNDEPKKEESEEEDLYDIETYFQKLLQPKPNLFKGLARERVCEICFKSGKLVKCKGPCCGTFHIECVTNENIKEEDTPIHPAKRGRKKKTTRACPWLCFDVNKENLDESISDEKDEPVMVIDADDFETKLAAKMKEILNPDEVIDIDSSSDEEITWTETKPGQCEIINVKLKIKQKIDNFKCNNCQNNDTPICFVCKSTKSPKNSKELRQRCTFAHCHLFYHVECLDHWPQTQISENRDKSVIESLTCPRHVCHTCVSDDPRGSKTRFSGDKLAKCVMCPATYHSFTKCLPAGSKILSASHILCPRHYDKGAGKVPSHVNAGWCFICALGGTLICCEYCPTSFHAECLQIKPPEGNYMCEDCETGRLPLYGEMVWVKLGHYRWWPGIVLHPTEIPDNIKAIKHSHGEFVVRFFGQYDHYWVNRGRVFPFQEGDSGRISSQKSKIDEAFSVAIEHASRAFEILKNAPPNGEEDTDIQSSLLPPHYVKLRVNKPVGSLVNKKIEDLNSLTQCECDPRDSDPCGVDSQCLNRMLLTECGPLCAAGDRCNNRMFEKRLYPRLAAQRVAGRGWGLRACEDIPAGRFVIEYVGELVDEVEFQRRMRSKHEQRDDNYYFLTLDKDRVIDAGPKGNLSRFMNHSCEPNCETQKWTVLGDVRVGLFALYDIPANSELTFNYNFECTGIEKKRCLCGAKRCSGYIGAKPKTLEETQPKKMKPIQKRTYKKRKIEESPPIKKVAKPRTTMRSKPKELTEIEKDLLIIKNATNSAISSDSENSSRLNSVDNDEKNALKRKRVNFSSEEVGQFNSDSSPAVKRLKTDEIDSVSEKSDTVPVV